MTPREITPLADLGRFMTPELLAQVKARQVSQDEPYLTEDRVSRIEPIRWVRAYAQANHAILDVLETHKKADDGTEIAALMLDRMADLASFAVQVYVSSRHDPKVLFRRKAREALEVTWAGLRRWFNAALEEAEPKLRAEYQEQLDEQLDAAFQMVDGANAETTTERRRADAAELSLSAVKAQHVNEMETALWRAGQVAKGELKVEKRRTEAAERQLAEGQTELTLLRQEVANTSAREREALSRIGELERQLAEVQGNLLAFSFRKETSRSAKVEEEFRIPKLPGTMKVKTVLDGLALVRRIRDEGDHAVFEPEARTVRSDDLGDIALASCMGAVADIEDKAGYLRAHLVTQGLVRP